MSTNLRASFTRRYSAGPEIVVENMYVSGAAGTTVLFGASGAGKTTVLHCLAGLERPEQGSICLDKEVWFDSGQRTFVPPRYRGLGFVPQEYALFPHLCVAHNIGYGLSDLASTKKQERVGETIKWLGLEGLENRRPDALSGGERQRVALARALVRRPKLLLLDEPLSALDGPTRLRLRGDLRHLLKQLAIPTVLVTHERSEALALGDQLMVMDAGRIIQCGPVHEVFSRPANVTVAGIVAMETVQPGKVVESGDGLVTVAAGRSKVVSLSPPLAPGTEVYVCIRAEDVILMKGPPSLSSPRNCMSVVVQNVMPDGPIMRIDLDSGFPLAASLTRQACAELAVAPGAQLIALVKAPQIHLIPR